MACKLRIIHNTYYPHLNKIVVAKFTKKIPKAAKFERQKLSKGKLLVMLLRNPFSYPKDPEVFL